MSKLYIDEILNKIKSAKTREEKVAILKSNNTPPLQQIVYANFSTRIKFLLPETPAPFKPNNMDSDLLPTTLYKEARKFYLFVQTGNAGISQIKRENLWIQLLESVSAAEAEVLENLKNKNLEQRYGLTLDVVQEAFPGILKPIDLPVETIKVSEVAKPKRRGRRPNKDVVNSL